MIDKIKQLLDYQAVDYESEKVEKAVINCEERRAAVQMKKKFEAIMENRKKLIAMLEKLKNELASVEAKCTELSAQTAQCQKEIQNDGEDIDKVENDLKRLRRITDATAELGEQIKQIIIRSQKADKMLSEQTANANAARDQYQACKQKYDERLKQEMPAIEAAKARRAEAAKNVDPELLKKYNALRVNKQVPTARLQGSTCTGCNMMLPSAIVSRVAAEKEIVECENCSRILYI